MSGDAIRLARPLVLTASDGRRPGAARTPRATRSRRASRRSGSPWSGPSCPTTAPRSRPRSATARGAHALIVTTGGTGLTPRDVTPAGDDRRHRLRGPGPGRGDAGRRPRHDAVGRPVARRRRRRRPDARRQRARQPAGRLESFAAIEPVLDHALETLAGPVRPRRTATGREDLPSRLMFEPFADVPAYPLVFPLFWGAVVFFCPGDGPPPAGLRRGPRQRPEPVRGRPARGSSG